MILKAEDVFKIYGSQGKNPFEALRNINFNMDEGDFVCVMGPSGAGKSTFVNTMSSIDLPTKGKVVAAGYDIKSLNEEEIGTFRYENIGFIFQEFNLVQSLTIYENIALPLILLKKSKEEIDEVVNEYAKKLHINDQLSKFPNEISGGQRQRVAICRSLVTRPKILVADEPTGNLDSINSNEILSYLTALNKKEGITILMVTHSSVIASFSKRFLFIKDGNIDDSLERGDLSQQEYYRKIVEINNKESK